VRQIGTAAGIVREMPYHGAARAVLRA
jgi:hypothetical protein